MGDNKPSIVKSIVGHYGEELGRDAVLREIDEVITSFGDYHLIQTIMRSKIVKDISGKESLIVDPISRCAIPITAERLREVLHRKVDISDKTFTCVYKYDPYKLKQLYQNSEGIWVYNQYRPPFWQSETFYSEGAIEIAPEKSLPDLYHKFIWHLVDSDKESYEYILNWLANALQRRNFCILTTIGASGIGKGTLGDIMRELVGKENFSETSNRILAERFNAQIKNKRIVYCDEASVKSQKEEERLKALVNNALEVEAKGKDAEQITNYASFYFSSNSLDAIKLTADDRRFSIVNLTDRKLPEVLTLNELKALTKKENIDALARYLFHRPVDEASMLKVFVSENTEKIRSASLTVWQDWFLDEYAIDHAGKTIKIEEISHAIEDKYGSRTRPGKKAFMELAKIYPAKLLVYRPKVGDKQVWAVKFPDKV